MTSFFAPPEIFSAYAFAEDGSDPDLTKGTHLRLFAGLGASFPIAPFAVFKITSQFNEPARIHYTDKDDQPVNDLNLSSSGAGEITLVLRDTDTQRTVRVELDDPEGKVAGVSLLGPKNKRVIAVRDRPRWMFSAPGMGKLAAWGSSTHIGFRIKSVDIDQILAQGPELAGILSLPVEGRHAWYVGGQNRVMGLERAKRGAPLRLNPMDRPDGPFDPTSSNDEVARVEAMLQAGQLAGGLEKMLANLVDAPEWPWTQTEKQAMITPDGKQQFAYAPRLGTLQMAAIDPGLARFFGFADLIEDLPDLDNHGGWDTLAVVGLFAFDPADFRRRGLDFSTPPQPGAGSDRLINMLVSALNEVTGQDTGAEIHDLIDIVRSQHLMVMPFVSLVAPVPPWLPPALPQAQIIQQYWQASTNGLPSSLYRATFAFPNAPLTSISALGAQINGSWVSRHDTLAVGNPPAERAMPRIFGHEQESRSRLGKLIQVALVFEPAGLLADQDIPADAGPVTYRVQAADFFGRFGSPVEFTLVPPPRPAPPPPVLRGHLERAVIDLTSPDPLPPGVIKMTVAVPHPAPAERFTPDEADRLGPVIVVPRIDDLTAGSLPLASLALSLPGQGPVTVDLSAPGFFDVELPLPALKPQEQQTWALTGVFTDSAGAVSAPGTLAVEVTDIRPPQVYPAGIGLFWTSAPGPSPEVELKLAWPAPAGSLHRVYLTDQQGLDLSPADIAETQPGAEPSRGRVAAVGCRKVLDHVPVNRLSFRLLTEQSIQAGPDGRAVLEARLPRSMATVQFLRVVPLGPDGAEPPFENCGIVPVAVPDSRRPAAPRLDGEVDPVTGAARLRITADGFDRVALQRDEPGLFTAGAEGSEPPQFRIRRAVGPVADPIYARQIGQGPLAQEDGAAAFLAAFTDDNAGRGLEPFVRYVYWAEVRLPPERRVPAGFALLDPPDGVTVVDPSAAENHPRPVSLPSAARVLMFVPPQPPAAPLAENITAERGPVDASGNISVTITIANLPRAHAKAVGPYRLAAWSQWPGQAIEAINNANGAVLDGTWPDISSGKTTFTVSLPAGVDPSSPLALRLGFVDPVDRLGEITTISVAPWSPPAPELSAVTIGTLVPPLATPPPRLIAGWQILAPAPIDLPAQYTLKVEVSVPGGANPPQVVQSTLDQLPQVLDVRNVSPLQVFALFNHIGQIHGKQQYFIFLHITHPVQVTVTLTDPSGRSVTQTGTA